MMQSNSTCHQTELLNEVLSLNAQEFYISAKGAYGGVILNEVLSLNAQE